MISGVSLNLRTLATGPVNVEMQLSRGEKPVGTLSCLIEFELVREVSVELSQIRVVSPSDSVYRFNLCDSIALSTTMRHGKTLQGFPWTIDDTPRQQESEPDKYSNSIPYSKMMSFKSYSSVRSLMATTLSLAFKGEHMALQAEIPISKYALDLKDENAFSVEAINTVDGESLEIKGTIKLRNRPIMMQMPGGVLTQRGVMDPVVAFSQLPLPYCMLHTTTVKEGDMLHPWVRVECLSSPPFYLNMENGKKVKQSIEDLQVVSSTRRSGSVSTRTSTYVFNELFLMEQSQKTLTPQSDGTAGRDDDDVTNGEEEERKVGDSAREEQEEERNVGDPARKSAAEDVEKDIIESIPIMLHRRRSTKLETALLAANNTGCWVCKVCCCICKLSALFCDQCASPSDAICPPPLSNDAIPNKEVSDLLAALKMLASVEEAEFPVPPPPSPPVSDNEEDDCEVPFIEPLQSPLAAFTSQFTSGSEETLEQVMRILSGVPSFQEVKMTETATTVETTFRRSSQVARRVSIPTVDPLPVVKSREEVPSARIILTAASTENATPLQLDSVLSIRDVPVSSTPKVDALPFDPPATPSAPALSGPALSGPALSAPALSAPALSAPALSAPAPQSAFQMAIEGSRRKASLKLDCVLDGIKSFNRGSLRMSEPVALPAPVVSQKKDGLGATADAFASMLASRRKSIRLEEDEIDDSCNEWD